MQTEPLSNSQFYAFSLVLWHILNESKTYNISLIKDFK